MGVIASMPTCRPWWLGYPDLISYGVAHNDMLAQNGSPPSLCIRNSQDCFHCTASLSVPTNSCGLEGFGRPCWPAAGQSLDNTDSVNDNFTCSLLPLSGQLPQNGSGTRERLRKDKDDETNTYSRNVSNGLCG